ncbi:MAG: Na-K-Cl cotransporter [Myxococcota bacterium]
MADAPPASNPENGEHKGRFGTFGGVFTPSILTILGVVMYMRVGWVTGQVGLGFALGIVVLSHLISLSTGLSIASIATNRTVGAGGAYFMISRALGAPAGAAIGIPLFFAQALSVTFYIVGFVESLNQLLPWVPPIVAGTIINVGLVALSIKSADLAIKAQYVVMIMIIASLVSFFTGFTEDFPRAVELSNPEGESIGSVFAVFFPAVTGIMAGVSMSGDLKDPRKSIPRGTLAAIAVGFVVYMSFPIWLALNMDNDTLINDLDSVFQISSVPALIYVGVWGATLSSALGSILTAPRTLQALAMDRLAPKLFARGWGKNNEPVAGLLLTFALAQTGIVLGSLDLIAPVLTMFFLATYGVTNLACGLERWASSPSFRPTFRVPAWVSLSGALACFYVMSYIDMLAMIVALIFCAVIFVVAQRRALGTTYGDARHGIWAALVRSALHRLRRVEFHPLNWRPNLVVFGGNPVKREYLLSLGSSIVQERGIITYFHLVKGRIVDQTAARKHLFETFEPQIAEGFPNVFYRVDISEDIYRGTVNTAQSYGVGNFEANTAMLGWPKKDERHEAYLNMLRDLLALDRSVLIVRYDPEKELGERKKIHVWWGGLHGNGGLMLLLAFLITANYQWRHASITVLTVVNDDALRGAAEENLRKVLDAARIQAETKIILRQGRSIADVMYVESADADLAIVGFVLPEERNAENPPSAEEFFARMNELLHRLPTTILVRSARNFEGEPVLFDSEK